MASYEIRPARVDEPSPTAAKMVETVTGVTVLSGSLEWLEKYCERFDLRAIRGGAFA